MSIFGMNKLLNDVMRKWQTWHIAEWRMNIERKKRQHFPLTRDEFQYNGEGM